MAQRISRVRIEAFPVYSPAERDLDRAIHLLGVPSAIAAASWLIWTTAFGGTARQIIAAATYASGLVLMLGASAAYNLARPGPGKAMLRHFDRAMIFVMIAGSYTPFALCALQPAIGGKLLAAAWTAALFGSALQFFAADRHPNACVLLYVVNGWMILPVLRPIMRAVAPGTLWLLIGGGVVYTIGAFIHTRQRWKFHNAIWHALVLAAAGLHLGAIVNVLRLQG